MCSPRLDPFRGERGATIYLVCLVFGISIWVGVVHHSGNPGLLRFVPPFVAGVDLNHNDHLGAEYYNIAVALASGRGFADPFGAGTGPTAWMPPLYCWLLASLITLLGDRTLVSLAVLLLQNIVLVVTGLVLYRTGRSADSPVPPWVRLVLYSVWLLVFFRWFFQVTHDTWLVLLFVVVHYVLGLARWRAAGSPAAWFGWGATAGVTMLAHPVLGLTWVVLWAMATVRHARPRLAAIALVPFLVIGGAWVVRNYAVFDRFILIKSNLFYDLYQANVEDADGVITEHSFANHPANRSEAYTSAGETAFLDGYRERAVAELRQHPGGYLTRVGNRMLAASLIYTPYFRWFENHLLIVKRLVYPLPYFGVLIVLFLSAFRLRPEALIAGVIYLCVLAPYVLVSFYIRYAIPLVLLQLLFCAWAIELVGERVASLTRSAR